MSHRIRLLLDALGRRNPGGKALVGQQGWLYLINDTNSFLHYQFGVERWTEGDIRLAGEVLAERSRLIEELGGRYLKLIQPERSTLYPDYLPEPLCRLSLYEPRPAQHITRLLPVQAAYPLEFFRTWKPRGHLFFHGDTHVNWLGSYVGYLATLELLAANGFASPVAPVLLSELDPKLVSYGGDLFDQLDADQKAQLSASMQGNMPRWGVEDLISYELPENMRDYTSRGDDGTYAAYNERALIVTEKADARLPRAVIFRGSSLALIQPLLSRHFSRAVYVWHKNLPYRDILERERPDVVLHCITERFVWDTGIKNPLYARP